MHQNQTETKQKIMRCIEQSKQEITSLYQSRYKEITKDGTEDHINEYVNLYKNNLENFKIRAKSISKVFFHQHDKMYHATPEEKETCQQLKDNAEKDALLAITTIKNAIEKDYQRIINSIINSQDSQ